jgi:hypothetical protein
MITFVLGLEGVWMINIRCVWERSRRRLSFACRNSMEFLLLQAHKSMATTPCVTPSSLFRSVTIHNCSITRNQQQQQKLRPYSVARSISSHSRLQGNVPFWLSLSLSVSVCPPVFLCLRFYSWLVFSIAAFLAFCVRDFMIRW